jgi:hypothetical protein
LVLILAKGSLKYSFVWFSSSTIFFHALYHAVIVSFLLPCWPLHMLNTYRIIPKFIISFSYWLDHVCVQHGRPKRQHMLLLAWFSGSFRHASPTTTTKWIHQQGDNPDTSLLIISFPHYSDDLVSAAPGLSFPYSFIFPQLRLSDSILIQFHQVPLTVPKFLPPRRSYLKW